MACCAWEGLTPFNKTTKSHNKQMMYSILCCCISCYFFTLSLSMCLCLAYVVYIYIFVTYLEGDTANRQVLVVLQHAEVLGHQGSSMDQTHSRLSVTLPVVVFLRHVLQPSQTEVRRCLVTLRYPGETRRRRIFV